MTIPLTCGNWEGVCTLPTLIRVKLRTFIQKFIFFWNQTVFRYKAWNHCRHFANIVEARMRMMSIERWDHGPENWKKMEQQGCSNWVSSFPRTFRITLTHKFLFMFQTFELLVFYYCKWKHCNWCGLLRVRHKELC